MREATCFPSVRFFTKWRPPRPLSWRELWRNLRGDHASGAAATREASSAMRWKRSNEPQRRLHARPAGMYAILLRWRWPWQERLRSRIDWRLRWTKIFLKILGSSFSTSPPFAPKSPSTATGMRKPSRRSKLPLRMNWLLRMPGGGHRTHSIPSVYEAALSGRTQGLRGCGGVPENGRQPAFLRQ